MEIPIRNLYILLCYAWDRLEEGELVDVVTDTPLGVANLLARILINGTQRLLRRGLDRGYLPFEEETSRLRGRIDFATTVNRLLHVQAKAHCQFDELTADVLHNQILRTTLGRLAQVESVDARHRTALLRIYRQMDGVTDIPLTTRHFGLVQFHSGTSTYRFLLNVCALVHESILPGQDEGRYRFRDFTRDKSRMSSLFERFVFNFYRIERPDLRVSSETLDWSAEPIRIRGPGRLPRMVTDVTLRGRDWTLVLDTKYYGKALDSQYGTPAFDSTNLYQLTAYLRAMEPRTGPDSEADGVLLYPTVSHAFDHSYMIGGHRVRLMTVDLAQEWDEMRQTLIDVPEWALARHTAHEIN